MVKILPLILVVIGIIVPRLFVSSINPFPIWIGSLKVILIILFDGTFTALLAGSTKVIVGGKVSIVTNVYIVAALAGLSVAVTLATPLTSPLPKIAFATPLTVNTRLFIVPNGVEVN